MKHKKVKMIINQKIKIIKGEGRYGFWEMEKSFF